MLSESSYFHKTLGKFLHLQEFIYFLKHNTRTHTQPLHGPFSVTTRVSRCQKKSARGLYGAKGDITGRHNDNPAVHHSIWTNQRPISFFPIFMPDALPAATLPIYPGFGQATDMLLACPVAWLHTLKQITIQ